MIHLPPVWWSIFRFMFVNDSWCVSLREIIINVLPSLLSLYIVQVLIIIFPLIWFYTEIAFFYTRYFVLLYSIEVSNILNSIYILYSNIWKALTRNWILNLPQPHLIVTQNPTVLLTILLYLDYFLYHFHHFEQYTYIAFQRMERVNKQQNIRPYQNYFLYYSRSTNGARSDL